MKSRVVFCALLASAVRQAGPQSVPVNDEQKMRAPVTAVATHPTVTPKAAPPVRHLSDAERAELRRQLQQFNRQYGSNKRP